MKSILAIVGAFGLLVMAAPAPSLLNMGSSSSAPAWINLPAAGEIGSIEYSGGPGAEWTSGTVTLELGADAARQFSAMKARLASNGFVIEEQLTSMDEFMGATSMALAYHPVTGRFLNILELATPSGALLRVTFEDGDPRLVTIR